MHRLRQKLLPSAETRKDEQEHLVVIEWLLSDWFSTFSSSTGEPQYSRSQARSRVGPGKRRNLADDGGADDAYKQRRLIIRCHIANVDCLRYSAKSRSRLSVFPFDLNQLPSQLPVPIPP